MDKIIKFAPFINISILGIIIFQNDSIERQNGVIKYRLEDTLYSIDRKLDRLNTDFTTKYLNDTKRFDELKTSLKNMNETIGDIDYMVWDNRR